MRYTIAYIYLTQIKETFTARRIEIQGPSRKRPEPRHTNTRTERKTNGPSEGGEKRRPRNAPPQGGWKTKPACRPVSAHRGCSLTISAKMPN